MNYNYARAFTVLVGLAMIFSNALYMGGQAPKWVSLAFTCSGSAWMFFFGYLAHRVSKRQEAGRRPTGMQMRRAAD